MEEVRKQKEAEAQQRREEVRKKKQQQDMEVKQNTIERERQLQAKKKQEEEAKRQKDRTEAERIRKQKEEQEQHRKADVNHRLTRMGGKQVMVSGDTKNGPVPPKKQAQPPKSKAAAVEEERRKAEEMLERTLQEKQKVAAAKANATVSKSAFPSFSHAGYDDLRGELKHVLVTKVVRKLGIAIDGGANTKQKAVIIREISVRDNTLVPSYLFPDF